MKAILKSLVVVIAACLTVVVITYSKNDTLRLESTLTTSAVPDVSLAFSVLGDVHEDIDKFHMAVNELHKINPAMDALVLNGDTVDQGIEKQYESINKALKKDKSILPETIIKNIGNHEFFDYDHDVNTPEEVKGFINRYLEFSGEKEVYHDTWVKGYHFISLGSENGNTKDFNSVSAYISDKQLNWFKNTIADKYEKCKPIFVFLHQNLSNSNKGWIGTEQAEDVKKILEKYPEAILFTSHTHAALETTNVTLNQPFTMIHTGAVHYTLKSDGKGGRSKTDDNAGLYIEVKENKVTVKGRDLKNKSWIFVQEISI